MVDKATGCEYMFQQSKLDQLAIMYRCFKRDSSSLKHITNKMKPYIVARGESIVKDEGLLKSPVLFSQKLLDLKAEMDTMVSVSFSNDV